MGGVDFGDLVLGGAGYAGLYRPVDDDTARDTLTAAWSSGIRAFDTAPHYGAGLSEERLGAFLASRPRDEYVVSTKVGRLLVDDPNAADGTDGFFGTPARSRRRDYSAAGVRRSLEESLQRLGLDRVDVLLIHDPDDHIDESIDCAAAELDNLRAAGLVDAIGVGVNDAAVALRFVREADVDCVLIAGRYTLLDRSASLLLDECGCRDVAVLAAGVFNSGLLADPATRHTFDYGPAGGDVVNTAMRMANLCAAQGVSLRAAALQFPLRHPAVTAVVSGATTSGEVTDTVEQLATPIPDELWDQLEELSWRR